MGLLDGGGAALMAAVLRGTYLDATLHRVTVTLDAQGGGSRDVAPTFTRRYKLDTGKSQCRTLSVFPIKIWPGLWKKA